MQKPKGEMRTKSLEELILISLDSILQNKERCSFGRLVKECFMLSPETFSLAEFPEWPDSLKLDRPLRELREKGLIWGSPRTHYSLTKFGENVVRKIKLSPDYKGKKLIKRKPTRSPDLETLDEIEKSRDFHQFVSNKKRFSPSNMRIRALLKLTLETPDEILINLLNHLRNIAEKNEQSDLAEFLRLYNEFVKEKKE